MFYCDRKIPSFKISVEYRNFSTFKQYLKHVKERSDLKLVRNGFRLTFSVEQGHLKDELLRGGVVKVFEP